MRIDATKELIKIKGVTLTFDDAKGFIKEHYADVCGQHLVGFRGKWVVDWMSVFKHAEETKILNVVQWRKTMKH
tara:strand:+ start:984 stop:1205 length:222 start_codon:yes stop_codon:yes gene_type:complete